MGGTEEEVKLARGPRPTAMLTGAEAAGGAAGPSTQFPMQR